MIFGFKTCALLRIHYIAELNDLKELITEAEEKKFPDSPLLQTLGEAVGEAEKCASVANQLVSAKVRTRYSVHIISMTRTMMGYSIIFELVCKRSLPQYMLQTQTVGGEQVCSQAKSG